MPPLDAWLWDRDAEIVVVGGGAAGLMAAVEAADGGANVLLLDKRPVLGGISGLAIGSVTASETALQKSAGIVDSHAAHLADLTALAAGRQGILDPDRLRILVVEAAASLARVIDFGVAFSGPHPEGPQTVPRMHSVLPDAQALVDVLAAACRRRGVEIALRHGAADVLLDEAGTVAGLAVIGPDGDRLRIRCRAIVLSAGDYVADAGWVAQTPGGGMAAPFRPFLTGDGIKMALRIGAAADNMGALSPPILRCVSPPHLQPSSELFAAGAVLVAADGGLVPVDFAACRARGVADGAFYVLVDASTEPLLARPGDDRGPGRDGWLRTGRPYVGTAPGVAYAYFEDCRSYPWFAACDGAPAVAARIGCAEKSLAEALAARPFPIAVLGPLRWYVMASSGGGLSTTGGMAVRAERGGTVAGLFAAGTNAARLQVKYIGGHGYGLAWALGSGRVAGRSAAGYLGAAKPPL